MTPEEAAGQVVEGRRRLTAAIHRVDDAQLVLRQRQTEDARTRAAKAERDRKLAEEAHLLALDLLREAIQAAPGVTEEA